MLNAEAMLSADGLHRRLSSVGTWQLEPQLERSPSRSVMSTSWVGAESPGTISRAQNHLAHGIFDEDRRLYKRPTSKVSFQAYPGVKGGTANPYFVTCCLRLTRSVQR